MTDIGKPELCFQWDKEVIEFVESLEYHGHEKTINLLRGPGFLGTGKGGTKTFDWSSWNWPLPGKTTRKKSCTGYTTDSGIHKNLLQSFLELAKEKKSGVISLVDNETVKVIPIALKKDGMSLKPGMQVDSRQGLIIGTTEKIDYQYVKQNPNPDPEKLKEIFIKEAECYCATTLDGKMNLPVGVDYITGSLSSTATCETIEKKALVSQVCLGHMTAGGAPQKNGVLLDSRQDCTSHCSGCALKGVLCSSCIKKGHAFVEPSLRACSRCLAANMKCIKAVALVFSMDSEIRNGGAQTLFKERKSNNSIDPHLKLSECLPDPVHVGKRISRQFSNWFLVVDGCRINRVQLRTLRNDPTIAEHLRGHLTVAACRNRDRMDVNSMLEISSEVVRNTIKDKVKFITNTIIPERFRVYEGNKRGILQNPTAVCLGPYGSIYIADTGKGKLFSARLHYPVDVTEICASLNCPLDIAYKDGGIYIAEYGAGRVSCVDMDNSLIYNPSKMNVRQLKRALEKLKLYQNADKNLRKAELQEKLKSWLESNTSSGHKVDSRSQVIAVPIRVHNTLAGSIKKPTALEFNRDHALFVADEVSHAIFQMNVESNGITITASIISKVDCPSQTYGIAPLDDHVYISSSNQLSGGIISFEYDRDQQRFPQSRSSPKLLLKNGTPECTKAHGLAVMPSHQIIFTDVTARKVKLLSVNGNSVTVEVISGSGLDEQADGSTASFSQPTSCCTELNTIFVCDSATGMVRMITRPAGFLAYLEKLNTFLRVFGVHRRDESRSQVPRIPPQEAIKTLQEVNNFFVQCEREVRELTNTNRTLQGPDGVCSPQTMRDLELTLNTVGNVVSLLHTVSPEFLNVLDLSSLTTLVVENLFSEMREGNDMPLVLQFSHRLSSTLREHLKRSTKCGFNYFTSSKSHYTKQKGFLPFSRLPVMPKPSPNNAVSTLQLAEMRKWREEYGQSVRQVTVRNKSTKDNPGTLPINCYVEKTTHARPVDFEHLQETTQQGVADYSVHPLFRKQSFVIIKPGYQPTFLQQAPFYVGRCTKDVFPSERQFEAAVYTKELLLPFHFHDSQGVYTVDVNGILTEVLSPTLEDDLIVFNEEEYHCYMVQCLDYGDPLTARETGEEMSNELTEMEDEDIQRDTRGSTTRSGRKSRRPRESSFLFYD